jgi:hypothetical protein
MRKKCSEAFLDMPKVLMALINAILASPPRRPFLYGGDELAF